jgi:hypothetical protein
VFSVNRAIVAVLLARGLWEVRGRGARVHARPTTGWTLVHRRPWETRSWENGPDASVGGASDRCVDILFGYCLWSRIPTGEPVGSVIGDRLGEKGVCQTLRRYVETASIPGTAPHDLRRAWATLCRAAGGEIDERLFPLRTKGADVGEAIFA